MAVLVKLETPKKGIITPVGIWPTNRNTPKIYQAQWDTGATDSAISTRVLEDLGLTPIGKSKCGLLTDGAWKVTTMFVYSIDILISDTIICKDIKVNAFDMPEVDVLIGMDVISTGDFTLYKQNGKTIFTFRLIENEEDEISPRGIEES